MPSKSKSISLFYFVESNLHVGSGATLSDIDLPIQREVHTEQPIVPATSLKGALRDLARGSNGRLSKPFEVIFGPESNNTEDAGGDHGGLAIFGEARVALFPVAASDGVYRWLTCPMAISRLRRDLRVRALDVPSRAVADKLAAIKVPTPVKWNLVVAADGSASRLYLRDFELEVDTKQSSAELGAWFAQHVLDAGNGYWSERMKNDVVIVSDEVFNHMVRFATHIDTHVKISAQTGTVEHGPWLEESLPADTLLWSMVDLPEPLGVILEKLDGGQPLELVRGLIAANARFQLGGGRSVGMGWISVAELHNANA